MKTIGRYTIMGLLGRGGMGKVYRVELSPIGKIAALKLLAPDPLVAKLMGMGHLRELFISEARTMAGLQHPNIVGIQDFDEDNGRLFYTMEYHADNLGAMIGERFRPDLPSRKIDIDKALRYVRQTLDGLQRLHAAGIIHRDIKPFNLLLTAWDTLKICDFGLSRPRGERFTGPSNLNVGSPFYAAPEQERSPDDVDVRADLYSVGVMLYRMLTGGLPPEPTSRAKPLRPSLLNPDLDAVWDDFINKTLAVDPDKRFETADHMLDALDRLETHWRDQKEKICRPPWAAEAPEAARALKHRLRTLAVKLPPARAAERFGLDALWRPANPITNAFTPRPDGAVFDHATGLTWQQHGSAYPCAWTKARDHINALNRDGFAGRNDWRMPTMDELITLLRPPLRAGDLCIPSLFDPTQRRIWSCDRRSYTAAYYADIALGFVGWRDFSAPGHVRAVA